MIFWAVNKEEPHGINCKHWRDIRDSCHTMRQYSCACQTSESDLLANAVSRPHFESRSNMGILGSTSSWSPKDSFLSSKSVAVQAFDNDYLFYCRTNSTCAEDPEKISTQQPAEGARQGTQHRVRFSCISECDQFLGNNTNQELKVARNKEVVDAKRKDSWHLPHVQHNLGKENKTSASDQSRALAPSTHVRGIDRICGQTVPSPVHKLENKNCFVPKPILKRIPCRAENDETSEEFVSVHDMWVPQRQTNWLRTIRLLEKNVEKDELSAQLREMQQPIEETQELEQCKPQKQLVKSPSHQNQEEQQECKQSQQKQQVKPQSHQDPGNKYIKPQSHQDPGNQQVKPQSHQDPGNQQVKPQLHQDPGNKHIKPQSHQDPGNQQIKPQSHQDPGNKQIKPQSHQDPGNKQIKPQSHPEHVNHEECKLCQKLKQHKQNHRSVSAHNVKTAKLPNAEALHSGRKDNIAVGHTKKRERKPGPKPAGCSANILVYDSESGALSAKLLMNPNHHDKMFRKFPRSLSQGWQH
ncbi:hypothetical protein BsWGS_23997 [Bradybaena similaris]